MEDLNFVTNSPAALKHLSASTEGGGNLSRQFFNLLRTFGHSRLASKNIISF